MRTQTKTTQNANFLKKTNNINRRSGSWRTALKPGDWLCVAFFEYELAVGNGSIFMRPLAGSFPPVNAV